jgi:hypothetical protein
MYPMEPDGDRLTIDLDHPVFSGERIRMYEAD